jgi:mannose-6-phosphate isomerase-like protein (cupin superfamily)
MTVVQPDAFQFRPSSEAEGGASVPFARIFGEEAFDSGFRWLDLCIVKPGAQIGVHAHHVDDEVYTIVKGRATMDVNGQEASVGPGDTILLRSGGSHGLRNESSDEVHVLVIDLLAPPVPNQRLLLRNMDEVPLVSKRSAGGAGEIFVGDIFTSDELGEAWDFVQCVKLPPGSAIGLHEHSGDEELYYIFSGCGTMVEDEQEYDVGPGTASLCKSGGRHSLVNTAEGEMTVLVAQAPLT